MDYIQLDYESEYYCPVYKKVISADLCYDSLMCLNRSFKISSTKELLEVQDIDSARKTCVQCQYSEL
jgi:hypothetical protein